MNEGRIDRGGMAPGEYRTGRDGTRVKGDGEDPEGMAGESEGRSARGLRRYGIRGVRWGRGLAGRPGTSMAQAIRGVWRAMPGTWQRVLKRIRSKPYGLVSKQRTWMPRWGQRQQFSMRVWGRRAVACGSHNHSGADGWDG